MPRKNPVAHREIEIGERLRLARESLKLSRPQLASRLGIDSSRLTTYELGHVPTPYEIGDAIAHEALVSQRWLATGLLPMEHYFEVSDTVRIAIPARLYFSFVYDRVLAEWIDSALAATATAHNLPIDQLDVLTLAEIDPLGCLPDDLGLHGRETLLQSFSVMAWMLPPDLRWEFFSQLNTQANRFIGKHKAAIDKFKKERDTLRQQQTTALIQKVRSALQR